ncbi:MAG: right-handed parallel beta-helix repeat-containing protein [Planctomycetes bacterium]|nr:right-handed parallel beta-helix repeat-containing protein [Planctomycetota bacterium]
MDKTDKTPQTFYVATDGSDSWSGKLDAPNASATDGPFATLRRARDAGRGLKASGGGPDRPIHILVRGGKYFLQEPLILTAADSGTAEFPVTWGACPGESPVLSGGYRVQDWKAYAGAILRAELPGSKGGKWLFRQLFCNGRRMPRARWPKPDPRDPLYSGWAFTERPVESPAGGRSTISFQYKPGTFRHRWSKPTQAEVKVFAGVGWFMKTVPVKSIDEEKRILTLAYDQWDTDVFPWYLPMGFTADNRFCVENVLEELDRPGEWCFDSEEGLLYFMPPFEHTSGQSSPLDVVVPALDCLVDLRGASWVTLRGFTFTETLDGDHLHPEGTGGWGAMGVWMGPRPVCNAVRLRDAEQCVLENNHFRDVGWNAIYLEDRNVRNVIRRNEISGAGANGICLAGSQLRHPVFNEVSDNHIHHCGDLTKYVAGVSLGTSDGNFIRHNRIERLPHHAINLAVNPEGRNYVEYNEIRWACEEIADTAAINCWMELGGPEAQRNGHVIRFNLISDICGIEVKEGKIVRSQHFPTSGLYLDNCASNCLVFGNLFLRCGMAGVLIHNGKNNLIENNVFVDCKASVRLQDWIVTLPYWARLAGFMTGNLVQRNICYQTRPDTFLYHLQGCAASTGWSPLSVASADANLYYRTGDGDYRVFFEGKLAPSPVFQRLEASEGKALDAADTLEVWKALGFDLHSRFQDPLFVDPAGDDYRLRPDSPAFALGFQPIPISEIGIRPTPSNART